eukprot:CAMPEP_0119142080 /NCGR_PEP_ID=MMETSP1310-20130426/32051_1 /TAXON_ID=464262 /ORGANISM="Genus nov. species nov., Strain RCC2339" /LENGTH=313 /DNA_ID=CAMNT_0007133591 /DNA_START=42 /DNA_END=980 /DNA_ORIENTATION=-
MAQCTYLTLFVVATLPWIADAAIPPRETLTYLESSSGMRRRSTYDPKSRTLLIQFQMQSPGGGLNNMIMKAIRFIELAWMEQQKAYQTSLYDEVHVRLPMLGLYPFGEYFDFPTIQNRFSKAYNISLVEASVRHSRLLVIDTVMHGDLMSDIMYASLTPTKRVEQMVEGCLRNLKGKDYVAVHFRLENDFQGQYCKAREHDGEYAPRLCFSASEIIRQVTHAPSPFGNTQTAWVIGNQLRMVTENPLQNWPTGWRSVSKTSFGCVKRENSLLLAVIDFFLATRAAYFVGLTTSTFSNGVATKRAQFPTGTWPS